MKNEEKRAIAREILELIAPPLLEEGEITAAIFAAENGLSHKQASDDLERATKQGVIEKRGEKVLHNGAWQWAYRIPGK